MSQNFYIVENAKQLGPYSFEELKTKGIQKDTLVWTEGLDNWTKAEHVSLIKDILRATPPPIPTILDEKSQKVPPIPNPIKEKYFGYVLASRKERFLATLIETLILLIPVLILFGFDYFNDDSLFDLSAIIGYAIFSAILGAIFYSNWSGNLGHKIMDLKVISSIDGSDQNKALKGAVREGIKSVFSNFIIPIIWLLWDDDRQNLYDKISKTIVVKKSKVAS